MRYTLLIDGPSGSGKTTLSRTIGTRLGIKVVHLDDFYPGWGGLDAGARAVAETVLDPINPGYWQWDWEKDQRSKWVALNPAQDLVVEGVGAVTEASISKARKLGTVDTIRVEANAELRKRRALSRDPYFEPFWEMWAAQEVLLPTLPVDVVVRR